MARVIDGVVVLRHSLAGRVAYVVHSVRQPHKSYGKVVTKNRVYCVETYGASCVVGTKVSIKEIAPRSKTKKWGLCCA